MKTAKTVKTFLFAAVCMLVLVTSAGVMADGTVTVPVNAAPTSWKIAGVAESFGVGTASPGAQIQVIYLNGANILQTTIISATTQAEMTSYLGQLETPVAGEPAGVTFAARAQRHRMRITKWIVDNAKLTNITPE